MSCRWDLSAVCGLHQALFQSQLLMFKSCLAASLAAQRAAMQHAAKRDLFTGCGRVTVARVPSPHTSGHACLPASFAACAVLAAREAAAVQRRCAWRRYHLTHCTYHRLRVCMLVLPALAASQSDLTVLCDLGRGACSVVRKVRVPTAVASPHAHGMHARIAALESPLLHELFQ
jgi:hypothetical protein